MKTHPTARCTQKLRMRTSGEKISSKLLNVAVLGSLILSPCSVLADETATTAKPSATAASATASTTEQAAAPAGTVLQAGVQMIELNLQTLRDVGLDIKQVLKAAGSLYDEVTIQPVTIMTAPEVVGRGTIINIPIGFTPTGAGPQPKKVRVDLAMSQMRPIIQMMKQDMDEFEAGRRRLDITDEERQEWRPYFEQWIKLVNSMNDSLTRLEGLTKSPPYNNGSIASVAGDIQNAGKKIDEVRRKLYKSLQKQGKKKKNA